MEALIGAASDVVELTGAEVAGSEDTGAEGATADSVLETTVGCALETTEGSALETVVGSALETTVGSALDEATGAASDDELLRAGALLDEVTIGATEVTATLDDEAAATEVDDATATADVALSVVGVSPARIQPVLSVRALGQVTCT